MPEYSSTFQINDIILNISPSKIRVDRQSFNNVYQTLRTQSSIKSKSGFSTVDIYVTVEFTDDIPVGAPLNSPNGFQQLRDLVSQFRVTPFCYVENQLLRDEFMSGSTSHSMALALKQIEITKSNQPSDTNVIVVNLHFCWFNYSPFSRDFAYRQNIMGTTSTKDPIGSNPWLLMYIAEQTRHNYRKVNKLQTGLVLSFQEYKALTIKRYFEIRDKEVTALQKLSADLNQLTSSKEGTAVLDRVRNTLFDELQDQNWARSLRREVFGDTTSMFFDQDAKNVLSKVKNLLNETLEPGKLDKRFAIEAFGWQPIVLIDGGFLTIKDSPAAKAKSQNLTEYEPEETILLARERTLDFNEEGLIVQGVSVSFENILATLPLVGHPYPTYQHLGSINARVSFSIASTDQKAIGRLSDFYSAVEEQHHQYRNIPAGFRNIKVENDIVNMCGLEQFLPESISTENIEGEPGTFSTMFSLLDNPLTPETVEKIKPGQSFMSAPDLRAKIAGILEKNLKFMDNPWETVGDSLRLKKLKSFDEAFAEQQIKFINEGSLDREAWGKYRAAMYRMFTDNEWATADQRIMKAWGETISYYLYSGERSEKNAGFRRIVENYGQMLSSFLSGIFAAIGFTGFDE
jgi:hypothetical protein